MIRRTGGYLLWRVLGGLGLMWLGLVSGCAVLKPAAPDPVKEVMGRATERWQKLLAKDVAGAYEYHSTGSRALHTLEQYKARLNQSFWRDARVESAECEADVCVVTVAVDFVYRRARGLRHEGSASVKESWVKEDRTWWYVPEMK
jgi:hypothetical protein